VARAAQRVGLFRRNPARIPMRGIEFGLWVANAIDRRLPVRKARPSVVPPVPERRAGKDLVVIGRSADYS